VACADGFESAGGDDATGGDTTCTEIIVLIEDDCDGCVVSLAAPEISSDNYYGEVEIPPNFELSFDITPLGVESGWANIVHFTQGADWGTPGDRMPAIWFRPGTFELHICHDEVSSVNICYNSRALAQDVTTNVRIHYHERLLMIYFDDTYEGSVSFSADRASGSATMYISDPWYTPANAQLNDLTLVDTSLTENEASAISALSTATTEGVVVSLSECTIQFNTNYGEVAMPADFEISFDITPRATDANWANIVHFTQGGDYGTPGERMPAIWFRPGTFELHICHDEVSTLNVCYNSASLTQDVTTTVKVVYSQWSAHIYFDDELEGEIGFTAERASGSATMYMSDPWYPPANADLANFFLTDSDLYVPCEDLLGESGEVWKDSDGDGCDAYEWNVNWCGADFVETYRNDGYNGDEACCVCGGGTTPKTDAAISSQVEGDDAAVTSPQVVSEATGIVVETTNGTPVASTSLGMVTIPTNFDFSFDITPRSTTSDWANFVHFTGTGENNAGGGSRMPAIWFRPGTYELHICVDSELSTNVCYNSRALTQDVTTNLRVLFYDYSFEIYLDGVLEGTIGLSSVRISGDCEFYMSDPWYPAAGADVSNLIGRDMDAASWEEQWFDDVSFEVTPDLCDPNPCVNGACVYGFYESIGEVYLCECDAGYYGEHCDMAEDTDADDYSQYHP
jgi:hypothetical protein